MSDPTQVGLAMTGSQIDRRPLVVCGTCARRKQQAGGVQVTPARWICAVCWKGRLRRARA